MTALLKDNWKLFLVATLTLGLAPFDPPHVWSKLVWINGGGAFNGPEPMAFIDWLDLLVHGLPWILLVLSLLINGKSFIDKHRKVGD